MTIKRYNAGIQRAKGLLEMAASLYDSSLSFETDRAAEGVMQTNSRLGRRFVISMAARAGKHSNDVSLSFATGSFREIMAVAQGKLSLAWGESLGDVDDGIPGEKGLSPRRLPLRTIGVFPSYDV